MCISAARALAIPKKRRLLQRDIAESLSVGRPSCNGTGRHRFGLSIEQISQSWFQVWESELEAGGECDGWNDALTCEQHGRHLAERCLERKRRCRHQRRAIQNSSQRAGKFLVRHRMGCCSIDRPANRLRRKSMNVQSQQIAKVDPAHVLPPGSNPPAEPELEGADHLLKRSAGGVEDDPGTQVNYPEARLLRG